MGQCYNSTIIDASADQAWSTVRDFHELSWASPVVTSVEKVGRVSGTEPGARRVLNDVFHETLLRIDEAGRSLTYRIDDGPGPVARDAVEDYFGTLTVYPVTDSEQAFVEWRSEYRSNDPDAVGALCNPIYQALLAALKAHFA